MEPIFTLQYAEFAVADYLSKRIKKASVFIPISAQEKGIDLLLYKFMDGENRTVTVQVKMSRTYYNLGKYQYRLWFNRFEPQENADWFILVGIHAKYPEEAANAKPNDIKWDTVMLAFSKNEMKQFMDELRQKKDPSKLDHSVYFEFDNPSEIYQTRGCETEREMSKYLIENRIEEIAKSFQNESR